MQTPRRATSGPGMSSPRRTVGAAKMPSLGSPRTPEVPHPLADQGRPRGGGRASFWGANWCRSRVPDRYRGDDAAVDGRTFGAARLPDQLQDVMRLGCEPFPRGWRADRQN
jgi:hypothetical protein